MVSSILYDHNRGAGCIADEFHLHKQRDGVVTRREPQKVAFAFFQRFNTLKSLQPCHLSKHSKVLLPQQSCLQVKSRGNRG